MILQSQWRDRRNTYRNTYLETPVFGQLSQWCGRKEYSDNPLESVTLQRYHFVTALKRAPWGQHPRSTEVTQFCVTLHVPSTSSGK